MQGSFDWEERSPKGGRRAWALGAGGGLAGSVRLRLCVLSTCGQRRGGCPATTSGHNSALLTVPVPPSSQILSKCFGNGADAGISEHFTVSGIN